MALAPVAAEVLARGLLGLPLRAQLAVVPLSPVAAEIFARGLLGLTLRAQLAVVPLSPVAAEIFARGLLGLTVGQFILVPFAPVPAEVLAGHLFGLLQGHRGLGVFQPGDGAGGLFQQIRTHGLFLVDQQHAVAAHIAPAGRRDERRPLLHRLALVAGQIHAALLHHPVKGRKAVVPLAGDLDLIGGDGRAVHVQPVAREPGLDVLRTLDFIACRRDSHRAGADVPPQHGTEHHQRTAHRPHAQLLDACLTQCDHKHTLASHPFRFVRTAYAGDGGIMQKRDRFPAVPSRFLIHFPVAGVWR